MFSPVSKVSLQLVAGLYFHIPFCKQACHYCDFHFSTNLSLATDMTKAMKAEVDLRTDFLEGHPLKTVYFGGGTPSILSNDLLSELMGHVSDRFGLGHVSEVTCEANPDDLTEKKLNELRHLGFNRLSIGIQTFNNKLLNYLNRVHTAEEAGRCVSLAKESGFENISIDLIYAIPGQSIDDWLNDIRRAMELEPQHISSYALTIEEKTVFGRWTKKGSMHAPDETVAAKHFEILVEELAKHGFTQYEVSNFSKPGFESKHNSSYWKGVPYLGIGPSAHSYNGRERHYNVSNNFTYVREIAAGRLPGEHETLSRHDRINEYLMTRLRTRWGCDLQWMNLHLQYDLLQSNKNYIENLVSEGFAYVEADHLLLTRKGLMIADKISSDLFLIE